MLTSDALSVSLLEAMSFGCIPIVSDLPDNREWVENGINGIVMKAGTQIKEIDAILSNSQDIFQMNREMITREAIFPTSIRSYIQKLNELI